MTDNPPSSRRHIRRLVGIYNANSTLRGEIAYWIGAQLGHTHCALCNITHSAIRERRDWQTCRAALPVTFDTYHRNDQPEHLGDFTHDQAPVVVADTDLGPVLLLGPQELEACASSPARLVEALTEAADAKHLDWT